MSMIPRDIVDAVRERTDIVEVISRHVRLERKGASWVGLCPFHKEKSPSFNVIPGKQLYYCFGCQAAGDVFRFLMQVENLGFVEAVNALANAAGITIEQRELSDDERRRYRERGTLFDLMEEAAAWFESNLWTSADGAQARAYLEKRKMSDEMSRRARLGWAPAGWTRLADHLDRKGIRPDLILLGGLARQRDNGGLYDAFRERLIIPIRDERNRVIAFGGRILQGDGPKYINSSETPLYEKGRTLYGLDMAASAIRSRGRVVLVEGYFDVLAMHQGGFTETVATCGTALTPEHGHRLQTLARNVVLMTDSDAAGVAAVRKVIEKLGTAFHDKATTLFRAQLGDAKDPDELLVRHGPEAMERVLRGAEPIHAWFTRELLKEHGYSTTGRERALDELSRVVQGLSDLQIAEVAGLLRLNESAVRARLRSSADDAPARAAPALPITREVTHVVWLLVHRYGQVADLIQRVDPTLLREHTTAWPLIARLVQGEPPARIQDDLSDETARKLLGAVVARERLYSPEEAPLAMVDVLVRLARPRHDAEVAALQEALSAARREGRMDDAVAAMRASQALKTRWKDIESSLSDGNIEAVIRSLGPRAPVSP
jgi:DNA primase